MKVLLVAINAKYIHSNLAVFTLRDYVKAAGEEVEVAEYTINQLPFEILRDIYEKKPDVVAFSCYIWNISTVLWLTKHLKKVAKDITIWLGGPEASYDAKRLLMEHRELDLIMVGEGEQIFLELLQRKPLASIQSIAYREQEEIKVNPLREPMSLNEVPFVYEDLSPFENKIIYYETSRGCPFSCSYCLSSIDKKVRLRDFSLVEKELQFFLDHKVKQVKFVDRTFNCNRAHTMAILKYILEHDNGVTNFHFEVSADLLSEEELAVMSKMRPGLIQLEIGVQSTNPATIKEIDRTMNLDKLKQVVNQIHSMNNIHQHLDLIVGLPFEDYNTFIHSFNEVYAMRPNQLQMGFLKVLKGSKIYEKHKEYEIVYSDTAPYEVMATKWVTFEEVLTLKGVEEMLEVYYNSNQFTHTLPYLEPFFSSSFKLFLQLYEYYKKKNLLGLKFTRVARYDILRDFAKENLDIALEYLEELLVFDLYLREKLKKPPIWKRDISLSKKELRALQDAYQFKESGKMTHIEVFSYDMRSIEQPKQSSQVIIFDYSKRNPLTNEASVVVVEDFDYE